jgi:hypothetical protein
MNNAPAWMTRGGDRVGTGGGPPPSSAANEHDAFGRLSRETPDNNHTNTRGPPPPMDNRGHRGGGHYQNGGNQNQNGRDDRRFGGDRQQGHHHHNNDRGRMFDDRERFRGGPPPPDFRNGRGRGGGPPRGGGGRPGGPNRGNTNSGSSSNGAITFRSYEEEREWVENRRRKRLARTGKFDVPPTPEQIATDAAVAALTNPAATDFAGIPSDRNFAAVPQQTRHARRLYIGHLPPNVTEEELHVFFRGAVEEALVVKLPKGEDPILSVYINHERRFCFLEFKTVEMATACLALDGIDIHGKGKVKVRKDT